MIYLIGLSMLAELFVLWNIKTIREIRKAKDEGSINLSEYVEEHLGAVPILLFTSLLSIPYLIAVIVGAVRGYWPALAILIMGVAMSLVRQATKLRIPCWVDVSDTFICICLLAIWARLI